MSIKRWVKQRLLSALATRVPWPGRISYAQFGEDIAAHTLFRQYQIQQGFYVDVGAYDPIYLSNTYMFYQRGWSGITVEPAPGIAAEFRAVRPRDVHLETVIAPAGTTKTVPFFCFGNQSPYNTLSEHQARAYAGRSGTPYTTLELPCTTLGSILERHLPPGREVDLLCTDCEGMDAAILTAHDWPRYAAKVIVFEDETKGAEPSQLTQFLAGQGYEFFARIGPSVIMHRLSVR